MSSDFQQAFKNIRPSVVGIGHRDNSGFHFVGTGFVFDSSGWIMTNRHVLEVLVKREGDKLKLRLSDAVVFLFAQTKLEDSHFKNAGIRAVPIRKFDLQREGEKKVQRPFPIIPGFEAGQVLQPETADSRIHAVELQPAMATRSVGQASRLSPYLQTSLILGVLLHHSKPFIPSRKFKVRAFSVTS